MSKLSKTVSVEVLPPLPRADLRLSFCDRKQDALRRKIQTISERKSVAVWFERNGCIHCHGRSLPHGGNALCMTCRRHIYYELDKIDKEIKKGELR